MTNAGGLFARFQVGFPAEIAFIRRLTDRMDKAHAVGTRGNAVLAADAKVRVHVDNTAGGIAE